MKRGPTGRAAQIQGLITAGGWHIAQGLGFWAEFRVLRGETLITPCKKRRAKCYPRLHSQHCRTAKLELMHLTVPFATKWCHSDGEWSPAPGWAARLLAAGQGILEAPPLPWHQSSKSSAILLAAQSLLAGDRLSCQHPLTLMRKVAPRPTTVQFPAFPDASSCHKEQGGLPLSQADPPA